MIWQRRLVGQLRNCFPKVQFIFTTHSPTIVQGASDDAIFYRIYRDDKTGETLTSPAYLKKDIDHLMLNSLVTSPLFGLQDARVSSDVNDADTSDDYIQTRIRNRVDAAIATRKEAGKTLLTEAEIDALIDQILSEEQH